ncbi:tRNA (adenosine(37)-N6)-threonylcarbamoyltransferase complex transferase subunit TsaD [bacterium]|nr:tRNA (adenosine(37)-N6)-threonylcarbamoyltransferase complex transferase subunit TsaD [bacterium]
MAFLLGIETTCDETAAAVFLDDGTILSSVVASQAAIHARYGGVVPEIASRAHVERLLPVIDDALQQAKVTPEELSAVAVAYTPGLVGAILVGLSAAKGLCLALDIPLLGVHHIEGHIYACQMSHPEPVFPCIGLVVSGGHTNLFLCQSANDLTLLGATQDDAAGEAFDKIASLLRLPYPGGPSIQEAARQGNPKAFGFPRSLMDEGNLDFSFSGLKTAVLYAAFGQNAKNRDRELSESEVADLAASFQQAVVDVLVEKCRRALQQHQLRILCVGGGVAANRLLRDSLERMAERERVTLVIPPLSLCTDNAAMNAVATEKFRSGQFDSLDLDAVGGLIRKRS